MKKRHNLSRIGDCLGNLFAATLVSSVGVFRKIYCTVLLLSLLLFEPYHICMITNVRDLCDRSSWKEALLCKFTPQMKLFGIKFNGGVN
jgi:hypothetical protein